MVAKQRPWFAFGAFVLWLLLFPLQGPLLYAAPPTPPPPVGLFLLPHAAVLGAFGLSEPLRRKLGILSAGGAIACAVLTLAWPLLTTGHTTVLGLVGVLSAPVALRAASGLARARRPGHAGVGGLVAANLAFPLFVHLPGPPVVRAACIAGLLLPSLGGRPLPAVPRSHVEHGSYFWFLLAMYGLNGVFYEQLFPAYAAVVSFPGIEVLPYAAAAGVSLYLARKRLKNILLSGIALGFLALAAFDRSDPLHVYGSMWLMQGASGFLDAFVVLLCLNQPDPLRAFALGIGAVCAGLGVGCMAVHVAGPSGTSIPLIGAFFLNGALLVLYAISADSEGSASASRPEPPGEPGLSRLSSVPFSCREYEVLRYLIQGLSNRAIAERLGISPSSVQTYARRIYAKTDVSGREELLERVSRACDTAPPRAWPVRFPGRK